MMAAKIMIHWVLHRIHLCRKSLRVALLRLADAARFQYNRAHKCMHHEFVAGEYVRWKWNKSSTVAVGSDTIPEANMHGRRRILQHSYRSLS